MKKQVKIKSCESCGQSAELTIIQYPQSEKKWEYCGKCAEAFQKEQRVNRGLNEIMKTHPEAITNITIAEKLRAGDSVESVKKSLDINQKPELEADLQ